MAEKNFDAARYLTKVEGKDYLEVKWRLLWLRTEHPEAVVSTELVKHDGGMALFKAKVLLQNGAEASGWGSETVNDFSDYIEKAETKALGRACAALGYGTQFCEDFDFQSKTMSGDASQGQPLPRATAAQVKAIYSMAQSQHLTEEQLDHRSQETYGRPPAELTRKEASQFISKLRATVIT